VLVVDDDASIRLLCRLNLELEGWAVREAASLAEARQELSEGAVDVALVDVHVGSEDGALLVDEIRAGHPHAKVAMLTGSVGEPASPGAAPDKVIWKPFTLEQLTSAVDELASR
jgi:DNA-binding NtrC family response regulator